MSKTKISYKRHLLKTISYRLLSTGIGFFAMWWATGSIKIGAAFSIAEIIYKPIQYYLHERIWYKWIRFGVQIQKEKLKEVPSPIIEVEKKEEEKSTEIIPSKKTLNYSSKR